MNKKEKELVGALIGLAKACNVHLKTENTDSIIVKSLAAISVVSKSTITNNAPVLDVEGQDECAGNIDKSTKAQQIDKLLKSVREEKLVVAPDCATCLAPCGNTDEFNLDELQSPEVSQDVRNLKIELLNVSCKLAFKILNGNIKNTEAGIKLLYKALCVTSYDVTEERVQIVLGELETYFL